MSSLELGSRKHSGVSSGVVEWSPGLLTAILVIGGLLLPCIFAVSLATTNEVKVFGAVLGAIAALSIIARPRWGLLIFVALLYVRPEEIIPSLAGLRLTLTVSSVTLIGLFLQMALRRERFVRAPVNWLLMGFATVLILSTLQLGESGATVSAAMDVFRLVMVVLLVLNLVKEPGEYRQLVTAVLLCTSYLALYSLYMYFTGGAYQEEDVARSQATGIFSNPNDLAASIGPGIAMALSRTLNERGIKRYLYGVLVGLMIVAVLLTHSRGGLLALLTVCGAVMLLQVKNRKLGLVLAAAVVVVLLGASSGKGFDSKEESANSRLRFWDNALTHVAEKPALGVGYSHFVELNGGMMSHNSFITVLVETGVVGYFCFMGCIYYCFRGRKKDEENALPEPLERDILAARLALLGYLVAAFWGNRSYNPLFFLLLAMPIAAITSSTGLKSFPLAKGEIWRDAGKITLLCGSIVGVVMLMVSHLK